MAEITAQMVKELRKETGAAVLDSKKALEQHDGDFDKAKAFLAEKGLAKAAKKADRDASEGLVHTYTHTGGRVDRRHRRRVPSRALRAQCRGHR